MIRAALLAVFGIVLAGCYRTEAPPALAGELAITVRSRETHLVRAQGLVQREAARAVSERLGWAVGRSSSTQLLVTLEPEEFAATAHDNRGVPQRSRITLRGSALLTGPNGNAQTTFSASGNASGTADEPEALAQAARGVGDSLAAWLEGAPWQRR